MKLTRRDRALLAKLTACDCGDLAAWVFHFLRAVDKANRNGDTRNIQAVFNVVNKELGEPYASVKTFNL